MINKPCHPESLMEYHYYGGAFGYYHCVQDNRWFQSDLNGYHNPEEHMKEVDQPYTVDYLTDFARTYG